MFVIVRTGFKHKEKLKKLAGLLKNFGKTGNVFFSGVFVVELATITRHSKDRFK